MKILFIIRNLKLDCMPGVVGVEEILQDSNHTT
jgi:hypothetical protein